MQRLTHTQMEVNDQGGALEQNQNGQIKKLDRNPHWKMNQCSDSWYRLCFKTCWKWLRCLIFLQKWWHIFKDSLIWMGIVCNLFEIRNCSLLWHFIQYMNKLSVVQSVKYIPVNIFWPRLFSLIPSCFFAGCTSPKDCSSAVWTPDAQTAVIMPIWHWISMT